MLIIDKIKLVLLTIVTFGFIWIWINKKQNKNKQLSQSEKVTVNVRELKENMGAKNILSVSNTQNKVKINFASKEKVNQEAIHKMKGVSGTFVTSNTITLIVGNSASTLKEKLTVKK